MKLVFYSVVLNHHQAPLADAFYRLLGDDYIFVETGNLNDNKGATIDYSTRPYLLKAVTCSSNYLKALQLAETADCCVFAGLGALTFQKARMKKGLLSFDMSERWLKQGWLNLFSPAIFRMWMAYHWGRWGNRPLYKLCCSAFAKQDQHFLGTYLQKCYKWGYFTQVDRFEVEASSDVSTSSIAPLMWCSRYLKWKHPELPILLAHRLKKKGYKFVLDMYGSGEYEQASKDMAHRLQLEDVVRFQGNKPNHELLADMRKHSIFLFTSDRNEGWGAVANESLGSGCVLVASDGIGSSPYLVKEASSGFLFQSPNPASSLNHPDQQSLTDLCDKVEWLLTHPHEMRCMRQAAQRQMIELWSPEVAAKRLLCLIDHLQSHKETPFLEGPCSKA